MKSRGKQTRILKAIQVIFTLLFILVLLFVPAGTWRWPEAWIFILFYSTVVTWAVFWMKKKAPGLLKERQTKKKDSKTWDKIFMRAYSLMLARSATV